MVLEKRCSKCGETKPASEFHKHCRSKDGLRWQCKVCTAAANKQWREVNVEQNAAICKRWAQTNPEKCAAAQKRYRHAHPGLVAAYNKQYRRENPEKCTASQRQWRMANPDYNKRWSEENLEKRAATQQRRRACRVDATIENFDIMEVWRRDGNVCSYCGSTEDLTIDHIVPIAGGGAHSLDNLCIACRSCNCSKGTKDLDEWLQWKTQLSCRLYTEGDEQDDQDRICNKRTA